MTFVNLQKEVPAFEKAFEDLQNRNLSFEVPFVSIHKHFRTFGQGFEGLQKEISEPALLFRARSGPFVLAWGHVEFVAEGEDELAGVPFVHLFSDLIFEIINRT